MHCIRSRRVRITYRGACGDTNGLHQRKSSVGERGIGHVERGLSFLNADRPVHRADCVVKGNESDLDQDLSKRAKRELGTRLSVPNPHIGQHGIGHHREIALTKDYDDEKQTRKQQPCLLTSREFQKPQSLQSKSKRFCDSSLFVDWISDDGCDATVALADWPKFRGGSSNAVELDADLPVEFDGATGKNVAWKVSIPGRSVGGAIVVGNQVITTASDGMDERRVRLLSYDVETGMQNWVQEFVARGRPYCHPTSANAAPTPTSDGKRVYAFYSSNDLACVDLDGNLVWYRSLTSDFVKAF